MIAVTHGVEFDFDQLMPPVVRERRLGEVLEPIAPDDPRWSPMQGLKDKMVRDKAEGKNFAMQVVTEDSASIGTLTKGYSKVRSTDPKVQHPENSGLLRQLTGREHARVKEVPERLIEGLCNTTAHEVLGQGVVYPPFRDLGQHVGNALNRLAGREEVPLENRQLPIEGADLVEPSTAQMAGEILATLKLADADNGQYVGSIVVADDGVVIQDAGRGVGVVHQLELLDDAPKLGTSVKIRYARGVGKVRAERGPGREVSGRGVAA